jgi:hypothetical protein
MLADESHLTFVILIIFSKLFSRRNVNASKAESPSRCLQAKSRFLMFAEFIDRPISGQFQEKHFGQVTPYSIWVLFTDKGYQHWVGSFAQGWEGFPTLIFNLDEQEKALIVAGGDGYLINVLQKELLNEDELSGIKTAITDAERQRIIFSDGLNLHCIDFDGKVSILYDDHYFDDVELLEIRDGKLYARYWHYQSGNKPFSFEMDLVTREVKDSFYDQSTDYNTS